MATIGLADTSARAHFSVEIKEWLVLELSTPGMTVSRTDSNQAAVVTEVEAGQPVEIKALLSMAPGKDVLLKGIIYGAETDSQDELLQWTGEGEINGLGWLRLNQEFTIAAWAGPGLKQGRLILKAPDDKIQPARRWKAVFLLTSL
ncbi:MAG: hypothetical protein ACPLRX_01450 [Candidatus Saccharicenans sp.]